MTRAEGNRFFLAGSGALQGIHRRWFDRHAPAGSVDVVYSGDALGGFNISGPHARELLMRLTNEDISNDAFPFLSARSMSVGGIEARVLRVTFAGDLGYEIHAPLENQIELYDHITAAGADLGLCNVGARALDSLRLEKGWGRMGAELIKTITPLEARLGFLVDFDKGDFIGRDALVKWKERGPRWSRRSCSGPP